MIEKVVISPNALFSIIDSAEMHTAANRDYGFLMGIVNKSSIDVKAAYPVFELDLDNIGNFDVNKLEQSLLMHQVAVENHTFVGWYVTDPKLLDKTAQLFDYFDARSGATVQLSIDLTFSNKNSFNIQTCIRKLFGIPNDSLSCSAFINIPYSIGCHPSEKAALGLFATFLNMKNLPIPQLDDVSLIQRKFIDTSTSILHLVDLVKNKQGNHEMLQVQVNKAIEFFTKLTKFFSDNRSSYETMINDFATLQEIQCLVDEQLIIVEGFLHFLN